MEDLDIASARTIPSRWYTEEDHYRRDLINIFNRGWNLAGHESQVKTEGDFFTFLAGAENGIIVKGGAGGVVGLVNVCRHRAGPVVTQRCGHVRLFQCRYHGWTYDLEGRLTGTPEFQGVQNFKKEECPLPRFEIARLGPFIFASLNPMMTFSEFAGALGHDLAPLLQEGLEPFAEKDYPVECNWKVYVDNYLEGYHLPMVHKGLFAELDYSRYQTKTSSWYSEQVAPAKNTAMLYRREDGDQARYFWLFPNTMLNIYQGIVQTNVVIPVSPSRCLVKFTWFTEPSRLKASKQHVDEMMRFSDEIQEEDRLICESVQKNLNSVTYSNGPYSVKRENGVHHFHQLLKRLV